MSILSTLGIDWKLFLAQLVNFAILLVILQKFLYKPLLGILDTRSKTIEKSLENAKEIEQRLKQAEKQQEEILKTARAEASAVLESAQAIADQKRSAAATKAKEDVQSIVADARKKIELEKEQMLREAREQFSELVLTAVRTIAEEGLETSVSPALVKKVSDTVKKAKS